MEVTDPVLLELWRYEATLAATEPT